MSDITETSTTVDSADVSKAVTAAAMGNALEWFDFSIYSFMAATVGRPLPGSGAQHSDSWPDQGRVPALPEAHL